MAVTAQQEELKQLSWYLQQQLKPQAEVTPLQVQCALKEMLMVLVQHPPGNAPDPQHVFHTLERSITTLPPKLFNALPASLQGTQIKLFLRVLGQKQPYAFHHVKFPAVMPLPPPATSLGKAPSPAVAAPATSVGAAPANSAASPLPPQLPATEEAGALVYEPADEPDAAVPTSLTAYEAAPQRLPQLARSWLKPLLITGGGVAAALLLGTGLYALTRPCVIGPCTALETAQALSQQSTETLKAENSADAAQQATQQLTEARRLVAEIPPWSAQHGHAQVLQQQLDQVLAAEAQVAAASQNGGAATPTAADWQTTQALWQTAIAQLQAIPTDSALHSFAQQRVKDYQANLAFAGQRVGTNQEAQKRLASARKTAELAIARQNVAQKLPDWQQAQATWQVAINTLQQIPSGTTVYAEAQQLLASYQPKLATVRDRTTKEQLAQKVYTQATTYEKQAKASQQNNQWSQAAVSWQKALTAAQQIPTGTSITESAQTRVADYTGFLKQAQTVVKIRGDLERVCLAPEKICDYTITNEAIQVKFVPAYERKVRTLGGMSQFSGDQETMYRVNSHLASLGNALQAVSNNAGMPLQVYNSDNQLLGAFVPGG